MSLFFLRRPFALCLCAPLALMCGLALAPAHAQQSPTVAADAPRLSDAQSERAFWSEQEELSAAERTVLEHNVAVLARRGTTRWGEKLWNELRSQPVPNSGRSVGELEVSDPALAVAFYGDWLSRNTDVAPRSLELRVRVSSLVAQLLANDLGDARKALAVYDWSLASLRVGNDSSWQRLAIERDHLVLARRGQARQAQAVGLDAVAPQWVAALPPAVGGVKLDAASKADRLSVPNQISVRSARALPDSVKPLTVETLTDKQQTVPPLSAEAIFAVPVVELTIKTAPAVNPFAPFQVPTAVTLAAGETRTRQRAVAAMPLAVAGAVETIRPIEVDVNKARRDAALAQIQAGTLTPEAAWQSGALTYGNVVDFFETRRDKWIIHQRETAGGLHHQLLALLVNHEAEKLQTPSNVPLKLRLWLADYYQSRGDERCLAWAESVLSESRGPIEGENPLMFSAVERIAWFYRDKGQHQQCAQTWLRIADYCGGKGWWQADMWIMAARSLEQIGQNDKARELRAKVPSAGDGWLSGLARYDEAQTLIDQGQHAQARLLLQKPLEGTNAPNAQVGLLSLLADSYLQTGEFDKAQSAAQNALESLAQLKQAPTGPGFRYQVERARQIVAWSKERTAGASSAPFVYQPPS